MNEELLKEIKQTLPWLLAAALVVGGYYWVKDYRRSRAVTASETAVNVSLTDEIEDAVAKFDGAKTEGVLKLRLAKSYFDAGRFEEALAIYGELEQNAPKGLEYIPVVGKAECLEALEKLDEALAAYDSFAAAQPKSYLTLTAQLGAARCLAQQDNDRKSAIERLQALAETVKEDEIAKARVEATLDLVKRYEKRAAVSLFDAANDAAKQLEAAPSPTKAE